MVTTVNLSDPIATWVTKTNTISTDVGDKSSLSTSATGNLVLAINELKTQSDKVDSAGILQMIDANKYLDSSRVDSLLPKLGTDYIDSAISNSLFDTRLASKNTANLTEGTNLYYTTARADSDAKNAISVTDAGGDGSMSYNAGTGVLTYTGPTVSAVSELVPSGILMPYAGTSAPTGYLLCDGSAISRTTYSNLFAAISTTYGVGNGSSTFNIPDLRGRVIAGQDDMGGASANRLTNQTGGLNGDTLGGTGGAETHTLTTAQMPSHTHSVTAQTQVIGDDVNRGGSGQLGSAETFNTGSAGSGSAHNNVQPTIILNYIIKT